jgi:hypothetical protein
MVAPLKKSPLFSAYVGKYMMFAFLTSNWLFAGPHYVFALQTNSCYCVLHSLIIVSSVLKNGNSPGDIKSKGTQKGKNKQEPKINSPQRPFNYE